MNGSKYETALAEVQSVLSEWMSTDPGADERRLAQQIVDRLVAKGVIQSTDPEELGYRTGPLQPGRKVVPGDSSPVGEYTGLAAEQFLDRLERGDDE